MNSRYLHSPICTKGVHGDYIFTTVETTLRSLNAHSSPNVRVTDHTTKFHSGIELYFVTYFAFGTALRYKRVRFPMVSLEFFIDIILPAAL